MEKWAFYNSDGQIINGASGAWLFYSVLGEVQTTLSNGGGAGVEWSVLTNGDADQPELMFDSNGDVIMTETP